MSIQEQLKSLLEIGTGFPVFPIFADQDADFPHLTYQRIASTPENVMGGNGNPSISQCLMQIDIWARTYVQVQSISDVVAVSMLNWTIQNIQISLRDLYEPDTKTFRISMDYSIWYR
jgi:Protein of unknown function (DUF3168)